MHSLLQYWLLKFCKRFPIINFLFSCRQAWIISCRCRIRWERSNVWNKKDFIVIDRDLSSDQLLLNFWRLSDTGPWSGSVKVILATNVMKIFCDLYYIYIIKENILYFNACIWIRHSLLMLWYRFSHFLENLRKFSWHFCFHGRQSSFLAGMVVDSCSILPHILNRFLFIWTPFWFISVFESTAYLKFAKLQYVSPGFRCRVITGSLMRLY